MGIGHDAIDRMIRERAGRRGASPTAAAGDTLLHRHRAPLGGARVRAL